MVNSSPSSRRSYDQESRTIRVPICFVVVVGLLVANLFLSAKHELVGGLREGESWSTISGGPLGGYGNKGACGKITPRMQIKLSDLVRSSGWNISCGKWTFPVNDVIQGQDITNNSKIPHIIHQTSRDRCVVREFMENINKWKENFEGWNYYLHDDYAMERLVTEFSTDFPMLPLVWRNCITTGAMKADLWRLLVLWGYGGLYTDIDAMPRHFSSRDILPTDDAVFVVDFDGTTSFHFMAVAPKHPLLFSTLHRSIHNILYTADTGRINPVKVSGPNALRLGLQDFLRLAGRQVPSNTPDLPPGNYTGLERKKVRILSHAQDSEYYIVREAQKLGRKKKYLAAMNMSHFTNSMYIKSHTSCMALVLQDTVKAQRPT
jgi:hypothetical protein